MKIATWNVNSLRVRLPQVLDWLKTEQPDILAMQETKLTDDLFPVEPFGELGYEVAFSGQPTYNGVAIIAREPLSDVVTEIPGFEDHQRRVLAATIGDVRVIDLYVVNGESVGSEKYAYKLNWLNAVHDWVRDELARHPKTVVLGDFNIAPDDRDVHDPVAWHEKILCSTPERQALARLCKLGLVDVFRQFDQPEKTFSWWDYRMNGFRRNLGLRIDLVLASAPLAASCKASGIDRTPRGWERPSDHAPAWAQFD
ncbi:MAG: exodeoxyribonuclease III [Pseudomonadota bacterium]